jgi:hypothetical protein
MSGDIDKWLNAGVADELAAARAVSNGQPPAPVTSSSPSPAPSSPSSPNKPPSLANRGVNIRGGVIRNETTKIRSQVQNPVTNPRPSPDQRTLKGKNIPPPDPVSEFKAANPALAVPSVFTGMDIDLNKKVSPAPAPVQEKLVSSVAPPLTAAAAPAGTVVSFDTTVRQLVELAQGQPNGTLHIATGRFVLSVGILKASKSPESHQAAPKS